MTSQNDPLKVIVRGGPIEANAVVYGVVQNALSEAGFTDISVSSPQHDSEAILGEIPSLLDVLRAERPTLFDTPISVEQIAHADEVLTLTVNDPDNLGIARVVYGTDPAIVEEAVEAHAPATDDFAEPALQDDL
jgi:hypothetical protein